MSYGLTIELNVHFRMEFSILPLMQLNTFSISRCNRPPFFKHSNRIFYMGETQNLSPFRLHYTLRDEECPRDVRWLPTDVNVNDGTHGYRLW